MIDYDRYCAICGGLTQHREYQSVRKPRSEYYDDNDDGIIWDEEHTYDPEIVSHDDLDWVN